MHYDPMEKHMDLMRHAPRTMKYDGSIPFEQWQAAARNLKLPGNTTAPPARRRTCAASPAAADTAFMPRNPGRFSTK